jgi:tRNA pseudouridine38-40 synthase
VSEASGASDAALDGAGRCFRLVLEYDGAGFEGWQRQAGERPARTVQGVLAEAATALLGVEPRLRGAGRTDAGVHAEGQVASLSVATTLAPERLQAALNAHLPPDLAVVDCREAPSGWDALRGARAKHYRYRIWNGRGRSPLRRARWAHVREPLDVGRMRKAAEAFVGRHDFAAMQAAGSGVRTTVRTLTRLEVSGRRGGEIVLDVEGEGFLRHMVRNLAGTLIEVGRGRFDVFEPAEILAGRDRGRAGPTAPAAGLCLVRVWDDLDPGDRARGRGVPTRGGGAEVPDSVDGSGPVG